MGRMSKNKGARGEREAAAELQRLFGCDACRGRQYSGGDDSPDVKHSIAGVHVEVKRVETLRIYDSIGQAIIDAGEKLPIVLHRKNNRPWLAIMRLEDLPGLVVQLYLTLQENA
jgi:Holliday junction resolvase